MTRRQTATAPDGEPSVTIHQGDITRLPVDAVVNAANETLLGGGGVDGAIHRAAGPGLLAACRALPEVRPGVRCPTGEARLTPGFALPARHVIHTVGPVWRGGTHGEDALLVSCYRHAIDLAEGQGLVTLAFPAISCGVYGFPPDRAAVLAVRAIRQRLATTAAVARVTLVAFDGAMASHWRRGLEDDPAGGWDAVAHEVAAGRRASAVGAEVLRRWAQALQPGAMALDLGCGSGEPVARILSDAGATLSAVDASPRMIRAFHRTFPAARVECAPVETAALLDGTYDAVVAIGLLFLLPGAVQRDVIARVGKALVPGGRFLFTAPAQPAEWRDQSTGRSSRSLGDDAYRAALESAGLTVTATLVDEGENHYYAAEKRSAPPA